jgi:hypothetical protein
MQRLKARIHNLEQRSTNNNPFQTLTDEELEAKIEELEKRAGANLAQCTEEEIEELQRLFANLDKLFPMYASGDGSVPVRVSSKA